MAGGHRAGVAGFATLTVLLAATGHATAAATRYAEPGGNGPPADCPESDPCGIGQAIQGATVADGDTILLLPGAYTTPDASAITVAKAITVAPAGPTRPTITNGSSVFHVDHSGAVLRDLDIRSTALPSSTRAVDLLAGATGERLHIEARGTLGAIAVQLRDGATLRDSVAWAPTAAGIGVITGGGEPSAGGRLRNVTAVGGATDGYGLSVDGSFGPSQTTTARNTVAMGSTDVVVTQGAVGTVTFVADHSNYDTTSFEGGTAITETSIQAAPPLFAGAPTGDFHQLAASPTIDAGSADASDPVLGSSDIDGQVRVHGAAPDIGADEFVPPAGGHPTAPPEGSPPPPEGSTPAPGGTTLDSQPPETTITKEPDDRTTKDVARFKFVSSEPGSTFRCRRDKKPFKPCASPRKYRNLSEAKHKFQVAAVDPAGNVDPTPDKDTWKIVD